MMAKVNELSNLYTSGNPVLYTYTYDVNNNRTNMLMQNWNGTDWENSSLYSFLYDTNGNITNRLLQEWFNNVWKDNAKSDYTYDSNNNNIGELYQRWNDTLWFKSYIFSATYDASNYIKGRSFFVWKDFSTFLNSGDSAYYYFHTATDLNNYIIQEDITISPNPTSDDIRLDLPGKSEIEILNIKGQLIKTINTEEDFIRIDISGFARGIYFVKVKTKVGVEVKKFIKE
ncbi:MAG: T9SS type A sorting domain-containing protein [Bacteroidota bacterium]